MANGTLRSDVRPGQLVDIVLKQDQRTGKTTRGIVKELLTKSPQHPHGIKVRLQDGQVGRVKAIIGTAEDRLAGAVKATGASPEAGTPSTGGADA
ncbi:YwbE family protein [Paenibacillus thermoaerophilus]|uniref:YwbE family protein n=1 Tax=Paenibacillus thermoaerophilus TaxID=1215385 RepID=A0ABW2V7C1_9BACL|nr:YwbE family protein [Paenibacillus thermoaerophilus]TMV06608.1 YwbE family protein [Paenibacillus thermoaerophilus]